MKKIFIIAAFAGIVFASCKKEAPIAAVQNEGQQEITFSALNKAMTKGVLPAGNSFDGGARKIQVAGVMQTADEKWVDFLEPTPFSQDGSTGKWKATGKYYPLGSAATNFLAYSEAAGVTSIARWFGAKEVELYVTEETCAENDIVYAAFLGNKSTTPNPAFAHTQALVTVSIATTAGKITINKIGFEDVKTSGTLNIKLTTGATAPTAAAKWIYNAGCTCHYAEMPARQLSADISSATDEVDFVDVDGYPGDVTTTAVVLDKLFPEQELKAKTLVVNYTLGACTADARLEFTTGDQYQWAAGTHYTYTISVTPTEIEIDPSAASGAWSVTSVSGSTFD